MNDHLGKDLKIRFTGEINCTACGRETKKTFGQGFCFPCSQIRAEADICIVKPELCHHGEAGQSLPRRGTSPRASASSRTFCTAR